MDFKPYKVALIDARICERVNSVLSKYVDEIVPFSTDNITYNAVSCHVDVFLHVSEQKVIVAPNIPSYCIEKFEKNGIQYHYAKYPIGKDLKATTTLNCISSDGVLLHKKGFTDPEVLTQSKHSEFINVPNAYTRCTTIVISPKVAITSDRGIEKTLLSKKWNVCYFSPENIHIEDHDYGFLGGCCGLYDQKLFVLGNPMKHKDGEKLRLFLAAYNITIVPLFDTTLVDGGGIFLF